MSKLSEKLTNGIVVNKEMAVIERDFDGNIKNIKTIEYMTNNDIQRFLLSSKKIKENEKLVEEEKLSKEKQEKIIKENEHKKEKILNAFDMWHRDITKGLIEFDNETFESVVYWYRQYLNDNSIEVHNELKKYL